MKTLRFASYFHGLTNPNQKIDWEKITITNNFMFCTVMQNPEICKEFLETMLKIKIDHLDYVHGEDTISEDILEKGIRLDVHVKDSDREFDLEVQLVNTYELPLRARFYQSLLDAYALDKGLPYNKLKENYVLFICPFDLFDKSLPVYTFEKICLEDSEIKLGDKTKTIFYNFSEWRKVHDEEIKIMLKYFDGEKAESSLTNKIDKEVTRNRIKRQWREEYMTYEQDMAVRQQYWYKDGVAAGAAQQKAKDDLIIQEKDEALNEKDAEIARLKAQLAEKA